MTPASQMARALALGALLTTLPSLALAQEPTTPATPTPRSSKVRVLVTPDDATITLGERELGRGSATITLSEGSHTIRIEREGYTSQIETILLSDQTPSDIILRVNLSKTPAPPPETREPGLVDGLGTARGLTGALGLGLGIGLVATSAVLAASSGVPEACSSTSPAACDEAANLAGWASASGIAGGALLTAGVALIAWDVLAGAPGARVSIAPRQGGAHASFSLRF